LTTLKKKAKDDEKEPPAETKPDDAAKAIDDAVAKADKEEKKEEPANAADDAEKKEDEEEKKEETVAEAKSRRLKEIAKMKVADLIAKHKELDSHLKDQFAELEKILVDMNIKANFNPEIKKELEWAAAQIKLVLEATP